MKKFSISYLKSMQLYFTHQLVPKSDEPRPWGGPWECTNVKNNNLKAGKMGFWWPHEAFLPWISVLQHTWISFTIHIFLDHPMASVHNFWVQAGMWSIVALISDKISRTFFIFFHYFLPISQFLPFLHILCILRTPMDDPSSPVTPIRSPMSPDPNQSIVDIPEGNHQWIFDF